KHKIPVARFVSISDEKDCIKTGKIFKYPFLLKARMDAYDGRGNYVVKNEKEIKKALAKFVGRVLYAEKFVPFVKELAIVSARDIFGNIESYEVVETVHKNNICHIVRHPADIPDKTKQKAKKMAQKVLQALGGVGVFAVEMFLTKKGEVLVNEIAPRVHNSGHHTIESYSASQFEQHMRAIASMPLAKAESKAKASVMINILGDREGKAEYRLNKDAEKLHNTHIHIYGKMETRKERKMGHLTVLGNTVKEAEFKAKKVRKYISI
ncbi:MAG: ATP-grasp domain-containing protein, partial [Patescibacteria group bacterium]